MHLEHVQQMQKTKHQPEISKLSLITGCIAWPLSMVACVLETVFIYLNKKGRQNDGEFEEQPINLMPTTIPREDITSTLPYDGVLESTATCNNIPMKIKQVRYIENVVRIGFLMKISIKAVNSSSRLEDAMGYVLDHMLKDGPSAEGKYKQQQRQTKIKFKEIW